MKRSRRLILTGCRSDRYLLYDIQCTAGLRDRRSIQNGEGEKSQRWLPSHIYAGRGGSACGRRMPRRGGNQLAGCHPGFQRRIVEKVSPVKSGPQHQISMAQGSALEAMRGKKQ
ncbi:hypothetical protein JW964_16680 [candidate division KSB1 bacterium]|nr:hypothetical protein [candidate division KSB1 bacterium]